MKHICEKCGNSFSNKAGNFVKHQRVCDGTYKKFERSKNCKYCNKDFSEDMSSSEIANHTRWCDKNPKRDQYQKDTKKMRDGITANSRNKMKQGIIDAHIRGAYKKEGISEKAKNTKIKNGTLTHKETTKKLLSEKMKEYLRKNPEKHPWKNKNKSVPCENIKKLLKNNNFLFEEEFQPLSDRFFAIDIAFTDIKLAIEINGNQHYSDISKNILSEYYQQRHNLIESKGWTVLELNYTFGFKLNEFINILKNYDAIYFKDLILK